jgi:hypothetical protein
MGGAKLPEGGKRLAQLSGCNRDVLQPRYDFRQDN